MTNDESLYNLEIGQNSVLSSMSPQEAEAMVEVIDLVAQVAHYDSSARQV